MAENKHPEQSDVSLPQEVTDEHTSPLPQEVTDEHTSPLPSEVTDEHTSPLPQEVTDEVVRHYSPMIYRIALTKTKSTHDADDIFQEVFLKLVMRDKPFETEEHRKAWLIRVTINCCNSHFVAPWRKNVDSMEDVLLEQIADDEPVPGTEEESIDVYAEVMKLPEQMREVVLLFYYEDMSIREIAEVVGSSEVNVKKRLSRARQKLRLEMGVADDGQE